METRICQRCGTERPENEMHQETIIQQRFNHQTRKKYVATDKMWFCKNKPCAAHYQMSCEG